MLDAGCVAAGYFALDVVGRKELRIFVKEGCKDRLAAVA